MLAELAVGDPEPELRRAALKRLSDLALLRRSAEADADAGVREVAAARYRQLLAGGAEDLALDERLTELRDHADAAARAYVARRGREVALRVAALSGLDNPSVLEEAAGHDEAPQVRQAAAAALADPQALERLEHQLRERDVRLARKLRSRRQELEAQQKLAAERVAEYRRLAAEMAAYAAAPLIEGYAAAVTRLRNRWQTVGGEPPADARHAFESAQEQAQARLAEEPVSCRDLIERLRSHLAELRLAPEPEHALVASLQELLAGTTELPERTVPAERAVLEALAAELRAYLAAVERYLPLRDELAAHSSAQAPQQAERLRELVRLIDWDAPVAAPPVLARAEEVAAAPAAPAAPAVVAPSDESELRRQVEQTEEQLQELEAAIAGGTLKSAQEHARATLELLGALPPGSQKPLRARLRSLQARLSELRDWRHFAILPKQQALCERMEALDAADLEASELAAQLRELQRQWEATGGSESAEGRRLWGRFRDASERVFKRCRPYFEEMERQRQASRERRQQICEQLEQLLAQPDWEQLPGEFLARVRSQARREWQQAGPVERGARQLQRRFERLMQSLSAQIERCTTSRRERRAALVEQAEAAQELDDLAAATARVRELQAQWRQIGALSTGAERRQAQAFRSACDRVFARRSKQREQGEQQRAEALGQAEAICAQAEAAAEDELPLAAAEEAFSRWRSQLAAVPGLAAADLERLKKRLGAAAERLGRQHAERQRRSEAEQAQALRRRSKLCEQLEQLVLTAPVDAEQQAADLEREWQAEAELPAALAAGVAGRWEVAKAAFAGAGFSQTELDENRRLRRMLCVRMEILAGIDSPPADAQLRMDLQVERLAQGLKGGAREDPQELARELEAQWASCGPAEADAELERRFQAARGAIG